jgi:hypothetical protein
MKENISFEIYVHYVLQRKYQHLSHSLIYRNVYEDRKFPHLALIGLNNLHPCLPITRPVILHHIHSFSHETSKLTTTEYIETGIHYLSTYISNVDPSYHCSLKVYILMPKLRSGPGESAIWVPVGDMVHVERSGGMNVI